MRQRLLLATIWGKFNMTKSGCMSFIRWTLSVDKWAHTSHTKKIYCRQKRKREETTLKTRKSGWGRVCRFKLQSRHSHLVPSWWVPTQGCNWWSPWSLQVNHKKAAWSVKKKRKTSGDDCDLPFASTFLWATVCWIDLIVYWILH